MIVPVSAFDHGVARMHLQGVSDFAADYLRRGRGPFLISQGGGSTRIEPAMVDVLVKAGVPRHKIFIQRRMGKAPAQDSAELSFTGYTVTVPTCGDWSGQAGFDPSNQSHTNFGCAFQRNTGLMLSNPGDLSVTGDPVEGDAPSSDRIIDAFRDGKALGRPKPVLEQKEFSDVK